MRRCCNEPKKTCTSPCASVFTQARLQAILDALTAGDLAPFGAALALEATLQINDRPPVVGKAAILALLSKGIPLGYTILQFLIGVAPSGVSFVALALDVLVGQDTTAPANVILTLDARCQIQSIVEVIAMPREAREAREARKAAAGRRQAAGGSPR